SPGTREIALTYDDGPNDPYSFRLVETLSRYDVKATFFLIGRYVDQRPDIVRELVAQGHVVANHTYTHPNLIFRSQKEFRDELTRCERGRNEGVGDAQAPLLRPPVGGRRAAVVRSIWSQGFTPIMWSVTGYDWKAKSSEEIEGKVTSQVRGGDVVLLHDGGHL